MPFNTDSSMCNTNVVVCLIAKVQFRLKQIISAAPEQKEVRKKYMGRVQSHTLPPVGPSEGAGGIRLPGVSDFL